MGAGSTRTQFLLTAMWALCASGFGYFRKGNIAQCARGSSGWRTGLEKTGCCEILGGAARRNVKQLGPFAELIGSTRVFLKVEINLIKKKTT